MVRTSLSEPEPERDDPVVPVRQSDLDRLERSAKRGSRFGMIAVIGVAILAILIGAGIVVNQRRYEQNQRVAEGKEGKLAKDFAAVKKVADNLAQQSAQHALVTERQAEEITEARGVAQHALSLARETRESFEPITEQLELVNGQFVTLREADARLATADSTTTGAVTELASAFDAFRTQTNERVETVLRQTDEFSRRLEIAERRVDGFGKHLRISDVLNGTLHGVSIIHIWGTKGQGANASVTSKP